MKTKLLRKIRKEAKKYFFVIRYEDRYSVVRYYEALQLMQHISLNHITIHEAKRRCDKERREYILRHIRHNNYKRIY